jgi:hypothetical protein
MVHLDRMDARRRGSCCAEQQLRRRGCRVHGCITAWLKARRCGPARSRVPTATSCSADGCRGCSERGCVSAAHFGHALRHVRRDVGIGLPAQGWRAPASTYQRPVRRAAQGNGLVERPEARLGPTPRRRGLGSGFIDPAGSLGPEDPAPSRQVASPARWNSRPATSSS